MSRFTSTRLGLLLLLGFALGGCAGPQVLQDPAERAEARAALESRQAQLAGRDAWEVRARIAIRSDHEGWQANALWQQRGEDYRIDLVGPLGQGATRLRGDAYGVVLESGNGASAADSPEELLQRETGWRLPVGGLRYWMRGLPQPGTSAEYQLDLEGRLQTLRQDGWQVSFRRYTERDGIALPDRLDLEHAELRVRVVVDHWAFLGS